MKEGWIHKNFDQCLVKVPKQKAVKSKHYLEKGLFPIVSQDSSIISGYINNEGLLYKHDKPIVVFGDHTKNIKYIDFDFVVGADGVHILLTKDDILPKFFYYELCSIKLRNLGYARHYKLLKEKNITYPLNTYEQQQIVSFLDSEFEKIDALKANAEKQLQAAKDLFQKALKEMLTPKDGWEEKKLITEFKLKSGDYLPNKAQNKGEIPVYGGNGITGCHDSWNLNGEQILIGRVGALCGNIHYTNERIWVTDNAFIINGVDNNWYKRFLVYELKFIDLNQYASQTAQPVISNKSLKDVVLYKPALDEQQYIVAHLDALSAKVKQLEKNYNETITLCNDLKQSLLKRIFE